ncbi:nucleoside-diphosphate sugar epimerase [Paenibacillaceae bacterium]|nr:nucleoside-diphosphate sugar epimerase [Paenibacillaceae bacterium]
MEQPINEIVEHLSISYQQMARVLEAERDIVVRMAQVVHALPDHKPDFQGIAGLIENSQNVSKSVVSYLNSLADLQETIADNMSHVMKEMDGEAEE